jgi:DNA-binding HxlR family transcriptional regulator
MAEAVVDLNCPVGRAAAVIGSRWTALILRDLFLNKACRYQELLDSLAGIAPNTLSDRLKMLETQGIITRRFYEQHPPRAEYVLTEKGQQLGPILRAMRKWGDKYGLEDAP